MEPIDHFLILVLQELLEFRIQNETGSVQVCVKHMAISQTKNINYWYAQIHNFFYIVPEGLR